MEKKKEKKEQEKTIFVEISDTRRNGFLTPVDQLTRHHYQ